MPSYTYSPQFSLYDITNFTRGEELRNMHLVCPICFEVVNDPMGNTECCHIYCNACIASVIQVSECTRRLAKCPVCRAALTTIRNNYVKVMISRELVWCPSMCCVWEGTHANLMQHIYECPSVTVTCDTCHQEVVNEHHESVCDGILVRCTACNDQITMRLIKQHYLEHRINNHHASSIAVKKDIRMSLKKDIYISQIQNSIHTEVTKCVRQIRSHLNAYQDAIQLTKLYVDKYQYLNALTDEDVITFTDDLTIGDKIDVCDLKGKWYESEVIDLDDTRFKFHYIGWTSKWDEWIDRYSHRLLPLGTRSNGPYSIHKNHGANDSKPIKRAYYEAQKGMMTSVRKHILSMIRIQSKKEYKRMCDDIVRDLDLSYTDEKVESDGGDVDLTEYWEMIDDQYEESHVYDILSIDAYDIDKEIDINSFWALVERVDDDDCIVDDDDCIVDDDDCIVDDDDSINIVVYGQLPREQPRSDNEAPIIFSNITSGSAVLYPIMW